MKTITTRSSDAGLLHRVICEYREMPGLALTTEQACRLWNCDKATCQQVLETLIQRGVLRQTRDGRMIRAD